MSFFYRLAHAIGFRPWEAEQRRDAARVTAFFDREECERTPPWGAALDLGCGTGVQSVALARRGWKVTGIDNIKHAIHQARRRAADAGVDVRFLVGDVTRLRTDGTGGGFDFLLDFGCYHGLADAERHAYAAEVTAVAAPGATLLLFSFAPGRRGPLPRGTSRTELEATLQHWRVIADEPLRPPRFGPVKHADPRMYRLRRA